MASIIRIKRSSVSGNPSTLAAGELAYSALTDNGSNGGDRLYIGMGTETAGNAVNHIIIGGRYYTGLVDAGGAGGTLTTNAKSIPVLSATGTIDKWLVGNLQLTGNTLSSTNTNGDINVTPNGTGKTIITNLYTDAVTSLTEFIQDVSGGQIVGGTGITVTYNDAAGTTTIAAQTITLGSTVLTNGSTTTGLAGLSSLGVTGNTTLGGTLALTSDFTVNTNKFVVTATSGNTSVGGTLGVTGATTLSSTLGVTGAATLSSTLGVTGAVTLSSTLAVTGNTTLSGTLGVANNLAVNTNKFVVTASSGDTSVGGTLGVTGAATLSSTLAVTSNATVGGTLAVTGQATFNSVIDMTSHKITNLAEPTADSDAATKYYVDAARSGLDVKQSVRAATTANITLSNTQTVDGVALSVGDRVLVKDQTTGSQNGIYVVAAGAWSRATDADNNPGGEVTSGMFCFVEEGTVNSDTGFVLTTNDPITLGTTALSFALFSSSGTLIAGNGLSKNGYTLEVNVDNTTIDINSDTLRIKPTYVGQTSITTLGTIGTGTWQGSVIADAYINDALTISGGTVNNTPIGATTASTGAFTTLSASGAVSYTGTTDMTALGSANVVNAGGLSVAKKAVIGTGLYIGSAATSVTLTTPAIIAKNAGATYAQIAMINSSTSGSADFAAYADNGTDTAGWADMGMTGSVFSDTNYTITGKNDGYFFVQSVAGTGLTGNMVLATGGNGTTNDIVFGTGGFLTANEKMRFIHATGQLDIETTTASSSTSTGALRVRGGVGIAGNINMGGNLTGAGAATSNLDGFNIDGGTY